MRRRLGAVFAFGARGKWGGTLHVGRAFASAAKGKSCRKNDRGLNGGARDTWGRAGNDVMQYALGVSDADDPTNAPASPAREFRDVAFITQTLYRRACFALA